MVYICPGGNCTGIAIFFFDKVSHLKHPNGHASYDGHTLCDGHASYDGRASYDEHSL